MVLLLSLLPLVAASGGDLPFDSCPNQASPPPSLCAWLMGVPILSQLQRDTTTQLTILRVVIRRPTGSSRRHSLASYTLRLRPRSV